MWWIGLSLNASAKILWFDAVAAVLAFAIGGLVDDSVEHRQANAPGPALLGVGLAALWIVGLAFRQPVWVTWLNFVFAAASMGLAVARRVEAPRRSADTVVPVRHKKKPPRGQWPRGG